MAGLATEAATAFAGFLGAAAAVGFFAVAAEAALRAATGDGRVVARASGFLGAAGAAFVVAFAASGADFAFAATVLAAGFLAVDFKAVAFLDGVAVFADADVVEVLRAADFVVFEATGLEAADLTVALVFVLLAGELTFLVAVFAAALPFDALTTALFF